MMVTVKTSYNYNYRTNVVIINNDIDNVRDKWIGDNDTNDERSCSKYIKQELKL